jgi:hypothetical protein
MAELNRKDIWADDLVQAPLAYARNLEEAIQSTNNLLAAMKASEQNIKAAQTVGAVAKETRNLTTAQTELEKIQKRIATAEAQSSTEYQKSAASLANLKKETRDRTVIGERDAATINKQNSSLRQLEVALRKNRDAYKNLSSEQARNSKQGKALLTTIQQQDKDFKKLSGSIGQSQANVGNYQMAIQQALGPIGALSPALMGASTAIKATTTGTNLFSIALKAVPIFAVIGAVASLIAFFKSSERGAQKLRVITAALGQVFAEIRDVFVRVGEALANLTLDKVKQGFIDMGNAIKQFVIDKFELLLEGVTGIGTAFKLLFKGEFKEAAKVAGESLLKVVRATNPIAMVIEGIVDNVDNVKKAFKDFGDEVARDVQRAIDLQNQDNALRVKQRKFLKEEAELRQEILLAREKGNDQTLEDEERQAALAEALVKMDELTAARVKLKQEELDISKARAALDETGEEHMEEIGRLEAEVVQIANDGLNEKRRILSMESGLRDRIANKAKKEAEDEVKRNQEALKQVVIDRQAALDKEISAIKVMAIERGEVNEETDKKILEARKKASLEMIQLTIDQLEKELLIKDLSADEEKKIRAEIAKFQIKLTDEMYSQLAEDDDTYLSRLAGHLENAQQLYSDFSGAIIGIFNGMSARRIMTLESELEALDAATKKEIELAGDNDEAKRRIEERAEKRRESLNIKIKREQRRAARLDKAAALIGAGINTALAITNALATVKPYPAAVIAAISAGVLGGLQIAAIAAQPIPQFAKGTDSAPGGLAIVGERGQEIVREIGGRVSLTPDRPTLMHVPKGSEVIPHEETMRMLALSALGQETYTDREQARLISEIQDLKGTIKEYDSKIVKAIYANGGHLEKDGSILFRVTTDEQANRIRTRKSTMG